MQVEIIKFIQSFSSSFLDLFFELITMFGEETLLVAISAYVFLSIDKRKGYRLIFTISSSACINSVIKNIVKAERPIGYEGITSNRLETATSYSFPSGHTQSSSSFWTSLYLIFKNKSYLITGIIIVLLVAISRLYLGVHWPIDVICGALFGLLWSVLFNKVFNYIEKNNGYYILFIMSLAFVISSLIFGDDDFHKVSGLFTGLSIGYYIETRFVNLSIESIKNKKILSYIILIFGLLFIKSVLKLIFPSTAIFTMLRYFFVGFWAFGIFPIIAKSISKSN